MCTNISSFIFFLIIRKKRFESSFIDVDNNPKKFIDQLQRFEYLVTSSLHGYIFGRALGLKSTLYLPDEIHNEENLFKYKDFLSSIDENC